MNADETETKFTAAESQGLLDQIIEVWIMPEIERRGLSATVDTPYELDSAQIIFRGRDGPIVRLNEEIRGYAKLVAQRSFEKGGPVFKDDLTGILSFELADDELDSGHITIIHTPKGWFISFNALQKRQYCKEFLKKSQQFLDAAKFSASTGANSAAIENLWNSCELASKTHLILHSIIEPETRRHGPIQSNINRWSKLGNVRESFIAIFNALGNLRPTARYEPENPIRNITEAEIETVSEELKLLNSRCAPDRLP